VDDVDRHFCERQAKLLLNLADRSTHTELRENLLAMAGGWAAKLADGPDITKGAMLRGDPADA
jgi:hypothetical protein